MIIDNCEYQIIQPEDLVIIETWMAYLNEQEVIDYANGKRNYLTSWLQFNCKSAGIVMQHISHKPGFCFFKIYFSGYPIVYIPAFVKSNTIHKVENYNEYW